MAYGDHMKVSRGPYSHHFIDLGDGTAVHLWGTEKTGAAASVRHSWIAEFIRPGERVELVVHQGPVFQPQEVVSRARSCLGQSGYDLFSRNCEHFATWCKTGALRSDQVRTAVLLAGVAVGAYYLSRSA